MTTRLDDLHALRNRIESEIRAEERRLARVANLAAQLPPIPEYEVFETETARIRQWALDNDVPVSRTGKIRDVVREAFYAAQEASA